MTAPLRDKLAQLDGYVRELRSGLSRTADEQWAPVLTRALERMVQLVLECCADAGDLWLEQQGQRMGESAAGVFRNLRDAGVLDEALYQRFRRYVSARNRIVHDYDRVAPAEVRREAEGLVRDAAELAHRLLQRRDAGRVGERADGD